MVAKVRSVGIFGMRSFMVETEAVVLPGKQKFDLVGLPDTAVSEARERVESAIIDSGFSFPAFHVTVNLAPADVRKEGSVYDLPIMLALLMAGHQITFNASDCAFVGELSLSGDVRPVNGVLPMTIEAKKAGIKRIFVPEQNAEEGAVVKGIEVYGVQNVKQILTFFHEREYPGYPALVPVENQDFMPSEIVYPLDFSEVKGQGTAKRALEIAAAGGHNILLIGPPGSGKSMLAKRLPSILPDMSFEESLETTKIYSVAGALKEQGLITCRPFRSPHHTISAVGLSGGGTVPRPGELSLAHNGVLFLDEMPEFSRVAMEVMRQPIEDGEITISRVAGTLTFPSSVMLVCAMNPCPCGYRGHPQKKCTCTPQAAQRYLSRVSGPLLDRIDIQIEVPPVVYRDLAAVGGKPPETSAQIKARVDKARRIQFERFRGTGVNCNAKMTPAMVKKFCMMDEGGQKMLENAFTRLGLSARAYDKLLKISRTIADLAGSDMITLNHVAEAIRYRNLDRKMYTNENG